MTAGAPMSDAPELLPCPFCGKLASRDARNHIYETGCDNVGCSVLPSAVQLSQAAADEAWNRRATALAAAQAEIERLREALRFYANEDDWDDLKSDEAAAAFDRNTGSKLGYDNGETARAALSTKGTADAQDGMGEG